jgi:CDP-4-dehydro-6-deoxyglucose reductase
MLSEHVRSLVFEVTSGPLEYRAGQSLRLTVPTASGLEMRRAYSIASAPGRAGRNHVELAVTKVAGGPASMALHALECGAELDATGPNGGGLCRRADERDVSTLLVATGSGLAPLRAIAQEDIVRTEGAPLGLLFGCRTRGDILWRDELASWQKDCPRLDSVITLSRPDADWRGHTGHVQFHLAALVERVRPQLVLVCGLAADRVRTEIFDQ